MLEISALELFWKFLPAVLLVPFITFFLGRLAVSKERKLEYRTFFKTADLRANYKLTNMPNLKSGTKHLLPKEFKSAKKLLDARIIDPSSGPPPKIYYLKLSTLGKSIITGCSINITIGLLETSQKYNLTISLSVLEQDEDIYIPVDSLEMKPGSILIEKIKIVYRTQAGETLLFTSNREKTTDGETLYTDSHKAKIFPGLYYPITHSKGLDTPMLILKGDEIKGEKEL